MKKIVCSALLGKIYWATVNEKNRTMGYDKKDVTDDAIAAVFEWFIHQFEFEKDPDAEAFSITYPSADYELIMRKKQKETEPMTNGDKWRSMTDEQIAEIIQSDGCCSCPVDDRICEAETQKKFCLEEEEFNELCKAAIVKWLKQEAKE